MAIPESQLETWSHQGSVSQSSATYNSIKNVLEAAGTPYAGKSHSVFLQGSYGNNTNIYSESDVDIVIKLNNVWQDDLTALSEGEKEAYDKAYDIATYTHDQFKVDVQKVLKDKYGSDVTIGDKAISIAASGSRRKADVIASIGYRRYHKFNGIFDQSYDEGICFYNNAGEKIVNYPKQHSENLTIKHQDTNKWLKPMVRVLKNLKGKLVEEGIIDKKIAPSYFLEGLFYNVPDGKFGGSYENCFVNAINWIQQDADKDKLVCANEQYYLIRDHAHNTWPTANCELFLTSAVSLWKEW